MAKVGFWLNGSQGKLAGATMYKDGASGETIIREVNKHPRNPKTDKQIIQRIIMNTVTNAYSLLKPIVDHSFEGVKAGRDCMSYFTKQNVQFAREKIATMQSQGVDFYDMFNFNLFGERQFVNNQYLLSMGSLPTVPVSYDELLGVYIPNIIENTYGEVLAKLGLSRGDQLTFIMVGNRPRQTNKEIRFARVILDPIDAETKQTLPLSTVFTYNGEAYSPNPRNTGSVRLGIDQELGLLFYSDDLFITAGAVIVSRQSGEDWLRSTTYLTYGSNIDHSLGAAMDAAINGGTKIYAPNNYYLNNAGKDGRDIQVEPPFFDVQSVTLDGQPITVGTLLEKLMTEQQLEEGYLIVNAEGANMGEAIVKFDDIEVLSASFVDGVARIPLTDIQGDIVYSIYTNFGGKDIDVGCQFRVTVSPIQMVTANGVEVHNGDVLTGSQEVRVYGENLSSNDFELYFNDVQYTPLYEDENGFEFIIGDNGNVVIKVSLLTALSFSINGNVVPSILPTSFTAGQTATTTAATNSWISLIRNPGNCMNYPFIIEEKYFSLIVIGNFEESDLVKLSYENCEERAVSLTSVGNLKAVVTVIDSQKPAYIMYEGFIIAVFNYTN